MTLSADRFWNALGKPLADAEVRALLHELELSELCPKIEDGVSTDLEATKYGVAVFFRTAHHLRNIEALKGLPPATPIFSDVQFSAKGYGGGPAFAGQLTHGLSFADTRAVVRERLGPPSPSSPYAINDRWDFGDRYLTIDYRRDGNGIAQVACGLSWVV